MGVLTGRGEIRGRVTVIGMTLEYENMRQNHASKRKEKRGKYERGNLKQERTKEKKNGAKLGQDIYGKTQQPRGERSDLRWLAEKLSVCEERVYTGNQLVR